MNKTLVSAVVWIASLVWALMLIIYGSTDVQWAFFRPLSTVSGTLTFLFWAFDKYLWKCKPFQMIIDRPDLNGSWKGQIESSWVNPETQKKASPLEVYMVIRQTYSSIHMRQLTIESSSKLIVGTIQKEEDGVYNFIGTFINTPKANVRDRSPINYGGFVIQINGKVPYSLEGHYWTDRKTRGDIILTEKSTKQYYDYKHASSGQYKVLA